MRVGLCLLWAGVRRVAPECLVEVVLDEQGPSFDMRCTCTSATRTIGKEWTNASFEEGLRSVGCNLGPSPYDADSEWRGDRKYWLIRRVNWHDA